MRFSAVAAAAALVVVTGGASLAGTAAGGSVTTAHIPSRAATGNHAICHQTRRARSCLTRADNGITGTRNRLTFRNGINAYGGYWTINKVGNVSSSWPFRYAWANTRWHGWAVVQINSYLSGGLAAGKCRSGAHITVCQEPSGGTTYWVEVEKKKAWHFVSVAATDALYPIVGKRSSYVLQTNGNGRIAITAPNNGGASQTFALPGV